MRVQTHVAVRLTSSPLELTMVISRLPTSTKFFKFRGGGRGREGERGGREGGGVGKCGREGGRDGRRVCSSR